MARSVLEVASNEYGYRRLKDGSRYNYLIPHAADGNYTKLSGWIEPNKTVGFMREIILNTLEDTRDLAQDLKRGTLYETCESIWQFLHDHIQYKLESGEQLRRPSRSWYIDNISGIDCDCFSIFAGSILSNLGITYCIRIAGYAGSPSYQHVYIVVKTGNQEIIIDPVLHKFDLEKKPLFHKDTTMDGTYYLSGPGSSAPQEAQDLFARASEPLLSALISTREQLASNPLTFDNNSNMKPGDSMRIVNAIDNLIRIYGTPEFDQLLDQYIAEDTMNGLGSVGTGVKSFFGGIKNAVNTVKSNVQTAISNVKDKIDDSQLLQTIKEGAKDVIHTLNKFNPILAAGRGLVLVVLKVGVFNLSGIFLSHIRRNTAWGKFILEVWDFGGGNKDKFIAACEEGENLKGMGVVAETVAVAGTPAATMICTMVAKGIATGALKLAGDVVVSVGDAIITPTQTVNSTPRPASYSNTLPVSNTVRPSNSATPINIIAPAPPVNLGPPIKKLNGLGEDEAKSDIDAAAAATGDSKAKDPKAKEVEPSKIKALFDKIWEAIKKALSSKNVKAEVINQAIKEFANSGNDANGNPPPASDGEYRQPPPPPPPPTSKETPFRDEEGNLKKEVVAAGLGIGAMLAYGIYWYVSNSAMNGYDDEDEEHEDGYYKPSRLR